MFSPRFPVSKISSWSDDPNRTRTHLLIDNRWKLGIGLTRERKSLISHPAIPAHGFLGRTKIIRFLLKRTNFDPQLIRLSPLLKAQRYEKSLDRHIKRFMWAEWDLNRTVDFRVMSSNPKIGILERLTLPVNESDGPQTTRNQGCVTCGLDYNLFFLNPTGHLHAQIHLIQPKKVVLSLFTIQPPILIQCGFNLIGIKFSTNL